MGVVLTIAIDVARMKRLEVDPLPDMLGYAGWGWLRLTMVGCGWLKMEAKRVNGGGMNVNCGCQLPEA